MNKIIFLGGLILMLAGCVTKTPLISHAHMGHSLTTWHDTPGQLGLFDVAKKETAIALQEAQLAHTANRHSDALVHVDNVIHALNSDVQPFGTGLGYGAIRALSGAIDHLEFAASSEDASDNMIRSVVEIADLGDGIVRQLNESLNLAMHLKTTDRELLAIGTHDLLKLLDGATNASTSAERSANLVKFERQVSAMLAREADPPYEPVSRRYVLGLVKLPNGLWGYRLPRRQVDHSRHASYSSMGY